MQSYPRRMISKIEIEILRTQILLSVILEMEE
jgi:hypothetical protein